MAKNFKRVLLNVYSRALRYMLRKIPNPQQVAPTLSEHYLTSLAPRDDAIQENCNLTYYNCLSTALRDKKILSIALTGHFGCGKSTIIKTFDRYYSEDYNFLNISLATFGTKEESQNISPEHHNTSFPPDQTKATSDSNGEANRKEPECSDTTCPPDNTNYLVEHSILQQMFYQVRKNVIPKSRIKRISKGQTVFPLIMFVLWLFSVCCAFAIFRPQVFVNISWLSDFLRTMPYAINTVISTISFATFVIPAIYIFRFLKTTTFKKLNLNKLEIEIADEKNPSVLNKHLDEILYFFQSTKYDVVVLEDLDRFDAPNLFTKLREINTLVNHDIEANNSTFGRRNRNKVTFIYALQDHMFTGEERTKFFDVIIPVVPVLNHANSRAVMRRELNKIDIETASSIPEDLLSDIALYISDMRLLHNIINEFDVYRKSLNMNGLKEDKLLAIMVYKSIFPKDFAMLQNREGLLHEYFAGMDEARQKQVSSVQQEAECKRKLLKEAASSTINSITELNILFVHHLEKIAQKNHPGWFATAFSVKNSSHSRETLLATEVFSEIAENESIRVTIALVGRQNTSRTVDVKFSDVEASIGFESYKDRKEIILARSKTAQESIEAELIQLQEKQAKIKRAKLRETIESKHYKSPQPPSYIDIKTEIGRRKHSMLRLLLSQGYIDETYQSYLSYFYEGTLTNSDRVYVIGIKQGEIFDPDYRLYNVEEIVTREFSEYETIEQATKNVYMLNYCIGTLLFDTIVTMLKSSHQGSIRLLSFYFYTNDLRHKELIVSLYSLWPELWDVIQESTDLSPSEKAMHLELLIHNIESPLLMSIMNSTSLVQIISRQEDFISNVESLDEQRVMNFLATIQPLFSDLTYLPKNSALSTYIYRNNMYTISARMVSLMYITFIGKLDDGDPPTISSLLAADSEPLRANIEEHLERYLTQLIKAKDMVLRESEETIISILNNKRISHKLKLEVVSGYCIPIHSIESIDQDEAIWRQLFDSRTIVPSWENVWTFMLTYSDELLDVTVTSYIISGEVAKQLGKQPLDSADIGHDASMSDLVLLLLSSSDLGKGVITQLIDAVPLSYCLDDANLVCKEYLPLLVNRNFVRFTHSNYEYVSEHCISSLGVLVKNNLSSFLELAQEQELEISGEELTLILAEQNRKKKKKKIVLTVLEYGVPDDLSLFADEVCKLIGSDLTFTEDLSVPILSAILKATSDQELKLETLIFCMDFLKEKNITAILRTAGGSYAQITRSHKRIRLRKTSLNTRLASALEGREYISSVSIMDNDIRINTFMGDKEGNDH